MPSIRFAKSIPPISVETGANLMASLLAAGLPVASSCHGDGICGKCRVRVLEGAKNLSPEEAPEKLLRERLKIPSDQRVSCQARVLGDVTVDASYW